MSFAMIKFNTISLVQFLKYKWEWQLTLRLLKCLNHKDILLGHCSFYAEHIQEVVANTCFVLRHSNDSY